MPPHPHPDKGPPTADFTFNGRPMKGFAGEPIAASLMANRIEILHRSLLRHNPRGVRCAVGRCGQCMLQVDGRPNVRSCIELLKPGMDVRTQTGMPGPERDYLRPLGALAGAMPAGFQYRLFYRPRFMRPIFQKLLRTISGYGRVLPNTEQEVTPPPARLVWEKEVVIVGGGVAGMACALEVAASGASVLVLDDQRSLGGTARFEPESAPKAAELADLCLRHPSIEMRLERTTLAFEAGVVISRTPAGIEKVRPKLTVIATGGYDLIPPFAGNDSVRIYGERAAMRIVNGWRVMPATSAVVTGPNKELVVYALAHGDLTVSMESAPRKPVADEAMICSGSIPTYELQMAAGLSMTVDANGAVLARLSKGGVSSRRDVFVTGEAAGTCSHFEALQRGRLTGSFVIAALRGEFAAWEPDDDTAPAKPLEPIPGAMACVCEDVTETELAEVLHGDYADLESAKRFTSLSMGVCQGKYCLHRARCIASRVCGTPLEETPLTTQRPPLVPTPLSVLAAQSEGGEG